MKTVAPTNVSRVTICEPEVMKVQRFTDVGRICSAEGSETNIVASVFEDGQGEFVRRCRLSAQFAEVASCKIDAWHKANLSI
jgi:hypothetical protein